MFDEQKPGRRSFRLAIQSQCVGTEKLGVVRRRVLHGKGAAGKAGIFVQLEGFIVRVRAGRIENQNAESVARPAVVAQEAFQAGFLDAGLFMNGRDRGGGGFPGGFAQARVVGLGTPQNRVDESGGRRTEIERGDGGPVARLQERLAFRRGEEQFVRAVRIVVQQFDARDERAGSLAVGNQFRADEIAPGVGAQMRCINSAKDAVPIGVIALSAQ